MDANGSNPDKVRKFLLSGLPGRAPPGTDTGCANSGTAR
ncbi:hypothetical protein BZB76_1688 [Actinomadura pelletieri DSM 43383]|uniref:Uncharacterized protein n=1 Tax=Actinomadura pelletieri DSM 43383 TaxID=1120940 RepID=A0A495QS52_9ACTN|nr:hypothetical protein BZB76_1688 [Actinomadura pelletieri DSM 43383]